VSVELEDAVLSASDRVTDRMLGLSHDLHAHPEIAWEEVRSCARVAGELSDAGFEVQERFTGLETAFLARRGTGPLHLAVCAEYDALPGMGHACGHNVISAISTGAALALAPHVDDLGITLSVFGTPAEEGGGGKIEMLDRGGFAGVHAAAMVHPGPVDVAHAEPYAVSHSHIQYDGKSAHAAAYPDRGINAADAFTIAQVAIGMLRQQFPHDVRVHGVMTNGGEAPNAIPQRTEGRWYVRAGSLAELAALEQRVTRCFEAGAWATGCELTVTPESKPYAEFRNDDGLLDAYVRRAVP
jgi:amidohydrolase